MDNHRKGEKRKREEDQPPWQRYPSSRERESRSNGKERRLGKNWGNDQVRLNQIQENERMREWVAQEDDFVLRQAKKKAEIRVREGRANPIDQLAVTLRPIDPTRNVLDDEVEEADLDFVNPDSVFDDLSESQLNDLRKDIDTYLKLETNKHNRDYWKTMQVICRDRQKTMRANDPEGRVVSSVSSDIDRLLGPKSYEELERLELQIRDKLDSNEPIDTDYWQQLLSSLLIWKAKSKVKKLYQSVVETRINSLISESEKQAREAQNAFRVPTSALRPVSYSQRLDPDPLLQLQTSDKGLISMNEREFLQKIADDRRKIANMGYVPAPKSTPRQGTVGSTGSVTAARVETIHLNGRVDPNASSDESRLTKSLYEREVAKGVGEDEEVFVGEEEVETKNRNLWEGKYQARKPKYFNRVQMGYEWNKYNQTHYDHDNPPPKVVQGYKFHIFYPDLVDQTKAPTFKILREGGRKKGQSIAPAGEEDTCIIRFTAGPPYEDIAFRIVDRDWDYSAKHDRGFKSTFERGILTLHFSFKKIFYRK